MVGNVRSTLCTKFDKIITKQILPLIFPKVLKIIFIYNRVFNLGLTQTLRIIGALGVLAVR